MKKLKSYITGFVLALLLAGCSESFIDLEPRDQLSTDIAFTSLENLEGAILGVYERGRYPYGDLNFSLYKAFYTDIIMEGTHIQDQATWNQMQTLRGFDATNAGIVAIWDAYYAGLNRANDIIDKIDNLDYNQNNPEEVARRNAVLGEAYFFRAYFHQNLIEYWDNIVLADRVFSDPSQDYNLATPEAVYTLIVSDLEEAIDLLPEISDVSSRGKASKALARHQLALAHMNLGNWTDAAGLAEAVIADPGLNFVALDQVFNELNQDNAEVIFSWQFMPGQAANWTACQLIPLYDRCNGVARTFEQGGRPWSRNVPNPYYWTLFEENDLRLEAWHKRYWIYDVDTDEDPLPDGVSIGDTVTAENIDDVAGLGITAIYPTTTKYWEYAGLDRTIDDAASYKNVVLYRVSEAYLIAAEAYLQSGTNLTRGEELLNDVRERAGQDPIALTLDNLIDEQARELGFEGRRYPMLKRLGILSERITAQDSQLSANWLPFHVRWPLPKNFVDLTGVAQNEGYE